MAVWKRWLLGQRLPGWRVITCSRHPFPENCPWEMGPEDHIQVDLADPAGTLAAIAEIKERLDNV